MVLHSCCSWALVCKPWLQTFCDPVFLRRYRAFHRAPPLLGLPHMPQCFPYHGVAALPLPGRAPLARGPSTAATAAPSSTSRTGAAAGTSSSGTPSRATSSACRSRASPTGWSTPPWCSALSPAAMRPPRLPRLGPFPVAFIANNNDLEQDDKDVKASVYSSETSAGVGVIFVSTDAGLFTLALKTERVKKVGERGDYFSVLPYMSFYTPGGDRLAPPSVHPTARPSLPPSWPPPAPAAAGLEP
nr:unnamed protein product [Digitaria exilis]